jgi:hypothetical protein
VPSAPLFSFLDFALAASFSLGSGHFPLTITASAFDTNWRSPLLDTFFAVRKTGHRSTFWRNRNGNLATQSISRDWKFVPFALLERDGGTSDIRVTSVFFISSRHGTGICFGSGTGVFESDLLDQRVRG